LPKTRSAIQGPLKTARSGRRRGGIKRRRGGRNFGAAGDAKEINAVRQRSEGKGELIQKGGRAFLESKRKSLEGKKKKRRKKMKS